MPDPDSEAALESATLDLFARLKWETANCYDETFGPGNYRIVDESGKMVCYALPSDSAAQTDLAGMVGRKVGLVGTIEAYKPIAGALVRFTEIVELK